MLSWLGIRGPVGLYFSAAFALVTILASPSPADARWPDGVLNYCGFEGYWDEAGWRDLGWAAGGTPGVRFDREEKRFGKASLRIEGAAGETRAALQLDGNAVQPRGRYALRVWVKTVRRQLDFPFSDN